MQPKINFKLVLTLALCFTIIGCANRPTEYQVDPEIQFYGADKVKDKTVAINVIPPTSEAEVDSNYDLIKPDNDFAKAIKTSLIEALIKQGYKISSNKFFTDVNISLDFNQFQVKVSKGSIKQNIEVKGHLKVTLKRKPNTLTKSFARTQELTVALQANQAEVTGVANEVAGKLLQTAFSDESIMNFLNNMQ